MQTASPTKTIEDIREALTTVRAARHNRRLGLYQGRNGGGDWAEDREARCEAMGRDLDLRNDEIRRALGIVWAEHRLSERVSIAREAEQARPELVARLTRVRRERRQACKAVA